MTTKTNPLNSVRRIVLVLGAVFALVAAGGVGAAAENFMRDADADNAVAIRGCVIRFDERDAEGNTVPRIHANSSHYCVGVTEVTIENGDLVVYSNTVGPIVSLAVSPDESLAKLGFTCGGSGGGHRTAVRCYDRDGVKVDADSPRMYGQYNNLWLTWFTWQDD
ncbi:hypothetical protein [Parenemella sanctibonifatiensis]|nr:hypothetical protein [Parenemella sanctibonifatiensis]